MPIVNKEIQVYYPSWSGDQYTSIRYDLVTTIAYSFVYVKADGSLLKDSTYNPDPLVTYAHARGVKVILSVQDYSRADADGLLANSVSRTTSINNILAEVIAHNFDGIDNDIEKSSVTNPITGTPNKALMTALQTGLYNVFKASNPNYRISIAIGAYYPSVDNIFDLPVLQNYSDYFMIMGYDWYGDWSTTAGPNSPYILDDGTGNYPTIKHDESLMLNTYRNKLLFGVPWYGKMFVTVDGTRLSPKVTGTTVTYIDYKDYAVAISVPNDPNRKWDTVWQTPWYVYSQTGLISNSGFELGTLGWTTYTSGGTGQLYTYPEPGRVGGSSVAIEYPVISTNNGASWIQEATGISSTKTYKLSGWLKTQNVIGSGASIGTDWFGSTGYIGSSSIMATRITGTTGWTYFEGNLTPPTNTISANIILQLYNSSGKVWFDDIYFDTLTPSPIIWRQMHYDDIQSLGSKYDLVNSEGLAGIGVWQVASGTGRSELWQLIQDKFTSAPVSQDIFGINKIYSTNTGGREWFSKWNNGISRSWNDTQNDSYDPEFITANKGTGSWKADGVGNLKISGGAPRMYIIDPSQIKNWHNVEITLYGMRIADNNIAYGGLVSVARTNHYIDTNLCDTRGQAARMRYDGHADFEKETSHPNSVAVNNIPNPGGFPYNVWIGYKYVVYDLSNGNIKLELYRDDTDGLNGGTWTKINELIDDATNFGTISQGGISCKVGIDPALRLTSSDIRPGSETGKPNLAVYFRSDGVGTDGLWYKKASVREITVPQLPNITATTITLTPSATPCTAGTCTVGISVTWENTGTQPDSAVLSLTVDDIAVVPVPVAQTVAGLASVTKTFIIIELPAGTHKVCPAPN